MKNNEPFSPVKTVKKKLNYTVKVVFECVEFDVLKKM